MPKLKKQTDLSQNGFPKPKKVNCFQCAKEFYIKFVLPRQEYSQKNDWEYWTGEKGAKSTRKVKEQKICDSCLLKFYHDKPRYWSLVKDLKKRQQIRTYIYHGIIQSL